MLRPDSEQFENHAKEFEVLDSALNRFCELNGFKLERNLYRTPCRVLRKVGNPEQIIDIFQDGDWRTGPYNRNWTNTVGVASHFLPNQGDLYYLRLTDKVVSGLTLSSVMDDLEAILRQCLARLSGWTLQDFQKEGIRVTKTLQ